MPTKKPRTQQVRNVNHPGQVTNLDAAKYGAVKRAILKVLPRSAPGLTFAEISERVRPLLPETLFPGGAKVGWWTKSVQLDLEARKLMTRARSSPLRFRKV